MSDNAQEFRARIQAQLPDTTVTTEWDAPRLVLAVVAIEPEGATARADLALTEAAWANLGSGTWSTFDHLVAMVSSTLHKRLGRA